MLYNTWPTQQSLETASITETAAVTTSSAQMHFLSQKFYIEMLLNGTTNITLNYSTQDLVLVTGVACVDCSGLVVPDLFKILTEPIVAGMRLMPLLWARRLVVE